MKHNRMIGRLLSLALTLAMALTLAPSLALPARAAGEYPQITIIPNQFVSTPDDKGAGPELVTRFWAYQIFTGTLDENYVENRSINSLSNVEWGASITNQENLREALSDDETKASTLGITFALMLEAGNTYLDAENLEKYKTAYETQANWEPETESGEGKVGGTLTDAGRTALEAAFNEDLKRLTIGQLFTAAFKKNVGADIITNGAYTASMVIADFTPASGNVALAQAFYAIVFDRYSLADNPSGANAKKGDYKYLKNTDGEAKFAPEGSNTDNKYQGAYAVSRWETGTTPGYWAIGTMDRDHTKRELHDGYYMIRDAYEEENNEGKAKAAYMAGVFGYGSIEPKAEGPSVTKTFTNASGNSASFELGETVSFTLRGTLPENYYTGYAGYPYIFEDTMEAGLDFVGITRVYVRIPDNSGYIPRYDYYVVEEATGATGGNTGRGYRLEELEQDNGYKITVSFPNLKNVRGKKVRNQATWQTESTDEQIPITGKSEIYVVYTAVLNEKANITNPNTGNLNEVVLRYANNPLWDPAANSPNGTWDSDWDKAPTGRVRDFVRAYDFGIQLTVYDKKDDSEAEPPTDEPDTDETEESEPLSGAGFALRKGTDENVQYAILHKAKTPDFTEEDHRGRAEYTYYLAGWVSEADLYAYLAGEDTLTRTARSWDAPLETNATIGGFNVSSGDYYAAGVTEDNGRVRIVGLDNSAYYLEEVITPEGSAPVDDISVQFTTTGYDATGKLTDLTATAANAVVESAIMSGGEFQGNYEEIYQELVARLIIYTEPTIEVDTGGMGTALFYIGGGALLAGAALLLIFSNVRTKPGKHERRHRRI